MHTLTMSFRPPEGKKGGDMVDKDGWFNIPWLFESSSSSQLLFHTAVVNRHTSLFLWMSSAACFISLLIFNGYKITSSSLRWSESRKRTLEV